MTRRPRPNTTRRNNHAAPIAVRRDATIASTSRDGDGDELLTVIEVLTELKVSRSTWYHWRQVGKAPPAIKLPNGELRVRRSALADWLTEREERAA